MRPFLLKGHERPLTQVKYNREGDFLITCAKNNTPCLWWAEDGTRLGTYEGHGGAVFCCDINLDSTVLYTSSADSSVRMWELQTGRELFQVKINEPCRACKLSIGEQMLAFTADAFIGAAPKLHVLRLAEDLSEQSNKPIQSIECPKGRVTRVFWTDCNEKLITSHDGGFLRKWDFETGKLVQEAQIHEGDIQDFQLSSDATYGITASLDKTAKLVDLESLEVLKTYKAGKFVNSASISPLMDHIVLGGGQDASQVTTTSAKAGGFEARFFHKIYQEEFGNVRGHFGPINSISFSPDGRSFTTGGEDGYVRVHHLDMDYFTTKFF